MNPLSVFLILAVVLCTVYAAPAINSEQINDDRTGVPAHTTTHKPHRSTTHKPSKESVRVARQIGYGGTAAGMGSQLQGISSGYGYGYNNAVGLGGMGQQAGTNLGLYPGIMMG